MQCSKCGSKFEVVVFNDVEIERCTGCNGLWFDMLEKEDLVRMQGSESIDIGDPAEGARFDSFRNARCPKCNVRMVHMVDKDQSHIHYECCPTCYGCFFDAGEFRDLKELTVAERFASMLSTLRSHLRD